VVSPATETIAAIATPPGQGGVGIVRISGPDTPAIARELLGHLPRPRHAGMHDFREADQTLIDAGLALYFEAPASICITSWIWHRRKPLPTSLKVARPRQHAQPCVPCRAIFPGE